MIDLVNNQKQVMLAKIYFSVSTIMMNQNLASHFQKNAIILANEAQVAIAIAIVDEHGELLSFYKMDNVASHAAVLAQNKAYTAARDRQSTKNLAAWAKQTGKDLSYWTDPRFTGIAGGYPIEQNGKVIGAIGISGMAEEDDHELALRAVLPT